MDITGAGSVADLVTTVIEKIWPDKSEQEKQQLAMAMTIVQGQIEVNKTEAENSNLFVSGWRPFIGWACGCACVWNWMGISITKLICEIVGLNVVLSPASLSEMMPILIGMLGLGAYRTFEKTKGVAAK